MLPPNAGNTSSPTAIRLSAGNSGVIFESCYSHRASTVPGSLLISLRPTVSFNVFLVIIMCPFIIGIQERNVKNFLIFIQKIIE